MLITIKNGQNSKRSSVSQRQTKMCQALLKVLWVEGFILGYKIDNQNKKQVKIFLKYNNDKPAISSIQFLSKPSRRVYYSTRQLWKIDSNRSFIVLSTNQGFKSILECKKLRIGGEPFVAIN